MLGIILSPMEKRIRLGTLAENLSSNNYERTVISMKKFLVGFEFLEETNSFVCCKIIEAETEEDARQKYGELYDNPFYSSIKVIGECSDDGKYVKVPVTYFGIEN